MVDPRTANCARDAARAQGGSDDDERQTDKREDDRKCEVRDLLEVHAGLRRTCTRRCGVWASTGVIPAVAVACDRLPPA
jgi:hypothetical protein